MLRTPETPSEVPLDTFPSSQTSFLGDFGPDTGNVLKIYKRQGSLILTYLLSRKEGAIKIYSEQEQQKLLEDQDEEELNDEEWYEDFWEPWEKN